MRSGSAKMGAAQSGANVYARSQSAVGQREEIPALTSSATRQKRGGR
jgi:hypothetical protein